MEMYIADDSIQIVTCNGTREEYDTLLSREACRRSDSEKVWKFEICRLVICSGTGSRKWKTYQYIFKKVSSHTRCSATY